MGIPSGRIIDDSREVSASSGTFTRLNLLNQQDLRYLSRKHNADKQRHDIDMVAVSMKVEEWNASGENFVFIYKPQGMFGCSLVFLSLVVT